MRTSTFRGLLIAPVFLYVAAVDLGRFDGWSLPVVGVTLLTMLPIVSLVKPFDDARLFLPAWGLAMITGIGLAISNGVPTGAWSEVGAGVLLGAPIALLAGLLLWRASALVTLVGVQAGLAALLSLLASGSAASANGARPGASAWLLAFSQVNSSQILGLGRWIDGSGTSAIPPLAAVTDPVFLGLGLVALFAVVLALLERPAPSGTGPAPWDPKFSRSSGIAPLVAAVLAGLAFEGAAALFPRYALLAVALGVATGLAVVAVLSLRRFERVASPPTGPPGSSPRGRTTGPWVVGSAPRSSSPVR
ncbi:MAG TPA: hypothetical protein VGV64_02110 [Thermoplasmata archaeon]|nr:hypothetical protein [Thermoplasmata archaeon]